MAARVLKLFVLAGIFLPTLIVGLPAASQTYKEAAAAYARGDYATAYREFRRLAESGNAGAQVTLGFIYNSGTIIPRDYAKAVRWYRLAAEQGEAVAQYNLGLMHKFGRGVTQDAREAAKWFRSAASQGDAFAQVGLGYMYDIGQGIPQDYVEAARWYRRAASQGQAFAQFALGQMYEFGQGIPQDYTQAAKWYRRAAAQGDADAQSKYGILLRDGRGVRRDLVQAHKWLSLAASRFSASEKAERERAMGLRNWVTARITAAELARARKLARVWRPVTEEENWGPRAAGYTGWRSRVASIQRGLALLGYDPGPLDGVPGPQTRAAIGAFQASAKLQVDGRISRRLTRAITTALRATTSATAEPGPTRRALELVSTGSGFRVGAAGHVLTNAHVVRDCVEVRVSPLSGAAARRVVVAARDEASDLALVEGPRGSPFARFRAGRGIRPGAQVMVAGFPLRGVLATEVNISTGIVAALAGPRDDRRLIQISAPVQPGNSGGPVLDTAGNIVGVVVAKLDAIKIAGAIGDIPQNVNFAVSAGTVRAFLDAEGIAYETVPSNNALTSEDVATAARKFTVLVECWK